MITISPIKRVASVTTLALSSLLSPMALFAQNKVDSFEKEEVRLNVSTKGTSDEKLLLYAPSPKVTIAGEQKLASIVVDLDKNVLYKYNENGEPEIAYLVASGKPSSPTNTGIKVVSHVETYPYKTAPLRTKRRRHPNDYGPNILILRNVDSKTGMTSSTGEFIHGNNNISSLGKYASHGCIRMDNQVIKELAKTIKSGDLVKIVRAK